MTEGYGPNPAAMRALKAEASLSASRWIAARRPLPLWMQPQKQVSKSSVADHHLMGRKPRKPTRSSSE